jgi:hypothetical protein
LTFRWSVAVSTWHGLVAEAADQNRVADLLLLADEAPDLESAAHARGLAAGLQLPSAGTVFLFAGLMVDRPGARDRRLPAEAIPTAAAAIDAAFDELAAAAGDHAVSSAACGGDLLFAAAALERGLELDILIPLEVPEFLDTSVAFAGREWVTRFHAVVDDPLTTLHVMPRAVGATDTDGNPFERTNRWLVHYALCGTPRRVSLIVLWDEKPGRGPGGTGDLYDRAKGIATERRIIHPGRLGTRRIET